MQHVIICNRSSAAYRLTGNRLLDHSKLEPLKMALKGSSQRAQYFTNGYTDGKMIGVDLLKLKTRDTSYNKHVIIFYAIDQSKQLIGIIK